jgi:TPR repeat protein
LARNDTEAARLFKLAADQGHANAQTALDGLNKGRRA